MEGSPKKILEIVILCIEPKEIANTIIFISIIRKPLCINLKFSAYGYNSVNILHKILVNDIFGIIIVKIQLLFGKKCKKIIVQYCFFM